MQKSLGVSVLKIMASALNWLTSSSLRAFVLIFILAFGIRALGNELYILPSPERELGAIARVLADTGQFANPYMLETGPTAHLPPIPPMIVALIYYLFGNTWQAGYVFVMFHLHDQFADICHATLDHRRAWRRQTSGICRWADGRVHGGTGTTHTWRRPGRNTVGADAGRVLKKMEQ